MSLLSLKFRLYPTVNVEERLLFNLEVCRRTYNKLLEVKNKDDLSRLQLQAYLVNLKRDHSELKSVYSKVLQMVNNQLHYNLNVLAELKRNGRKVGKLRFKGKNQYRTLHFNQSGFKVDAENKRLWLSKIGSVSIKLHRVVNGAVKGVLVTHNGSGRWFAIFQVESTPTHLHPTRKTVGLDVGLKYFLTDSDGGQVENPRYYRKTLEKIRYLQRTLSRKRKGSANRRKAVLRLNRAYEELINQRNDFLHKLSTFYVRNYDIIAVENLNIPRMVLGNFAQSILDASWGKFFRMLFYKAENAGRILLKVNPAYTSELNKEKIEDRDLRGAINILNRGLSGLGQACVPVETRPLLAVSASRIVEAGSPYPSG
jgi:putative transposase